MSIYRLYGSVTTTTDAAASLDIRADGTITCWCVAGAVNGADALNDGALAEVAFGSTRQFTVNDSQNVVATVAVGRQGFLTSGGGPVAANVTMSGLRIPVAAGERIYLHLFVYGTTGVEVWATLYVDDGIDAATRPSRRRG